MIVLGVDLGIGKIACSVFDLSTELKLTMCPYLVTTSHDEKNRINARARELREIGYWMHDVILGTSADYVFIESIIVGNNHKYSLQLAQTLGAVLSRLPNSAIDSEIGCPTQLHLVDNKTWKKRLLSNGNATKDQIRDYIDTAHPAYALLCEGDQDRYDACCIGLYGLDVLAQSTELRLQPGLVPDSDWPVQR